MKKYIFVLAFMLVLVNPAYAQIASISQGDQSTPSSGNLTDGFDTWSMFVGNGYTANTTGAVITTAYDAFGNPSGEFRVDILSSPDGIETSGAFVTNYGDCTYFNSASGGVHTQGFSEVAVLFQNNNSGDPESRDACEIWPDRYYDIVITIHRDPSVFNSFVYYGSPVNDRPSWTIVNTVDGASGSVSPIYIPQFALEVNGFTISPASSTSAFDIIGAQQFCNAAFASSSGIGASIANGFCIVAGFLFIPSSSAITSFLIQKDQLLTHIPFSWINQSRMILEGYTASSTANFINLTLPFGTSTEALGLTSLTVVSTSTLSHYLPDSTRNAAKALIAVFFYLLAASFIYRDVQRIWHKQV